MLDRFLQEASRVVIGKEEQFRMALTCLFAGGHLLLEDEPGMGKTTFAKTLAKLLNLGWARIQFTSDLLPADIIGVSIFDREQQSFKFQAGPIFHQLVVGDEVNRASPKTQSAFLQAMEEHSVSIDGKTYELQKPFFFIATQNPRRSIGTFPLPESQLDRFLMKLELGYPSLEAERKILTHGNPVGALADLQPLMNTENIKVHQEAAAKVHVADTIVQYIVGIAQQSRRHPQGISPRASLGILHSAKALAYLSGRNFVTPEDVQEVAIPVMNHRLVSSEELNSQLGTERAKEILFAVKVP